MGLSSPGWTGDAAHGSRHAGGASLLARIFLSNFTCNMHFADRAVIVQKFYGERGGSRIIETSAINSSNRDRNSFRTGELFVLLYPMTRSIVGTSPASGRLTTDQGIRFCTYAGINVMPRIDATSDMTIAGLSAPCVGVIWTPERSR